MRALVIVLVLLGLVGAPVASAQIPGGIRVLNLESAADALDAYYSELFAISGVSYSSPGFIILQSDEDEAQTACGSARGGTGRAAFYCPLDHTIVMDRYLDQDIFGETREIEYIVLAHEWAHHIQNISGAEIVGRETLDPDDWDATYVVEQELRADCMAGVFMKMLDANGQFDMRTVVEVTQVFHNIGSDFHMWGYKNSHGTKIERAAALLTGYTDGLFGCMNITPLSVG